MRMKKFDMAMAAGRAYTKIVEERRYLAKLIIFPVIIKFITLLVLFSHEMFQDNLIRAALIQIPSFFVTGWMLSHWVRLVYLDQYWPFKPSGDEKADMAALDDRARGILSGTIMFVLIQLAVSALVAVISPMFEETDAEQMTSQQHFMVIALFVLMIWGFRYVWVYIPLAVNQQMRDFFRQVSHPGLSFYFIGTWLLCSAMGIAIMFTFTVPIIHSASEGSPLALFVATAAHALVASVTDIIACSGMCYALKDLSGEEKSDDH